MFFVVIGPVEPQNYTFGVSIFSRDDKRVIRLSIIAQCQLEGSNLGSGADRKTAFSVQRGEVATFYLDISILISVLNFLT